MLRELRAQYDLIIVRRACKTKRCILTARQVCILAQSLLSLGCESQGEPWKGVRDAIKDQNPDSGREEPHTLGGDTVDGFGHSLGRSTAKPSGCCHVVGPRGMSSLRRKRLCGTNAQRL
jgi:hypothetical protein